MVAAQAKPFPTQGCPLDSGVEQNPKVPGHFGIFGKISPNSRAIFGVCFYSAQKAGGFCARANRGDLGPNPAAGEAGSFDYGPAAARGRQRALVRLRFSVWCIERHRHRRLVRKGTQAKVGPLSGTRLRAGVIWGQTPLLARRAVAITAQPRCAGGSARWCVCDSAYGA